MFSFWQRKKQVQTNIVSTKEIHNRFDTEVNRLLEKAYVKLSEETDKQILIDKTIKLKKHGFHNLSETLLGQAEIDQIEKNKIANAENKHLKDVILYFGERYPFYKFITKIAVNQNCIVPCIISLFKSNTSYKKTLFGCNQMRIIFK